MDTPIERVVRATEASTIARARKILTHDTAALRPVINQLQDKTEDNQ